MTGVDVHIVFIRKLIIYSIAAEKLRCWHARQVLSNMSNKHVYPTALYTTAINVNII